MRRQVDDYRFVEDVDVEFGSPPQGRVAVPVTNVRVAPSGQASDPWDDEEAEQLAELWATAAGIVAGVALALVSRMRTRRRRR